jgi:nucleotide-binding universal stress UspA family protein
MYQLKRILVCVDLSEMDEDVIRYSSEITKLAEADTVYFLHVAKDLNLPPEIAEKYQNVLAPMDETIKHQVQDTVNKYFGERSGTQTDIDILEGKPTDQVLKYAKRKDVDLIVMGKHSGNTKPKVNQAKIAEISHCSVLFVPKGADIKIDSVMVAVDFSEYAKMALEQALHFKNKKEHMTVYGHHVYTVPHGYYKTGKSHKEFGEIMEGHAMKDADKFFKKYDLDKKLCEMRYTLSNDDKVHDELNDFAVNKDVDMILIGSQGRTAAAALLLGSVAEHILHYDNHLPVFIVKNKNDNMGLLQALLKI